MNEVSIKRSESNEPNVSLRTITYDIYNNGEYITTVSDICDALDLKSQMEQQS